jgi:hypothetical protein
MPRFFFNLHDDIISQVDEGRDLLDLKAARAAAVQSAKEMACAEVTDGHLHLSHRIEVTDAFGEVLDTVWFRDVVQVHD